MIAPRNAAVYAAAIGVLVIVACFAWVVVLLPNFVNIFTEFKSSLPFPTIVLLALERFPQLWPPLIVAGGILAALATLVVLRRR